MPEVVIHDDEKAGILFDLRRHRHYEMPSERRKRKLIAARRKIRHPRRP